MTGSIPAQAALSADPRPGEELATRKTPPAEAPDQAGSPPATEKPSGHSDGPAAGSSASSGQSGSQNARVTLSVDAQLREVIIRVVDPASGRVLRQIPSEERVRLQRAYAETQRGQGNAKGTDGLA